MPGKRADWRMKPRAGIMQECDSVDKEKMIGMMVDRYEQFILPERILLELISLGDRYVEASRKQYNEKGADHIPFTWEGQEFDLAFEPDMAEIRFGTYNVLANLSKEERFNVFCVMEIGRWIDYNRGFRMEAVSDFIAWADEWYVDGKKTNMKAEYLAGKITLSKWLRAGWDIIGPEYKRRRSLKLRKAINLRELEPLPYIIGHIAVIDEVENKNREAGQGANHVAGKKSNLRLLRDPGIVLTLEYKGITGTVEFSKRDYMYHGVIEGRPYEENASEGGACEGGLYDAKLYEGGTFEGRLYEDCLYEGLTLEELIDSFRGAAQKVIER